MRFFNRITAALIAGTALAAGHAAADTTETGASVKIDGARGSVFAAGASVEITGVVTPGLRPMTGVLAVGGAIDVSAAIDGALAMAGGDIDFSGAAESLFASGGNVLVSGRIEDDAMIAGGNIAVQSEALINNDLNAAGGVVDVAGTIKGDANLAGAFVSFNGAVAGDAEFAGEEIVIGPAARITGDLKYYAPQEAQIAPQAEISGEITYVKASERALEWERKRRMPFGRDDFPSRAYGALFWFVALGGSGALMALLFPRWLGEVAAAGRDRPLSSMALGFAFLVALPVAAILLMAMILGLPFGGFLLAVYGGILAVSMVGAGFAAGHLMLDRGDERRAKLLHYFAGLALLLILGAAPFIGGIVTFFAMILGVGVLFRGAWSSLRAEPT